MQNRNTGLFPVWPFHSTMISLSSLYSVYRIRHIGDWDLEKWEEHFQIRWFPFDCVSTRYANEKQSPRKNSIYPQLLEIFLLNLQFFRTGFRPYTLYIAN